MLATADFATFVSAVHGWSPFPWQQALVERIATDRSWPNVIDIPTGLGKTTVLDAALYLAAMHPDLARRRIFFVVDRRLVVDEAYEHALRIQQALANADQGVVAEVARALAQPGEHEHPVEVTRMRGGVTWDARWVRRPDRYAIITATVDQIGSRLLFRGYGVTEQARSIDAALVGTDSLIIVDEAHLAKPLVTTIGTLTRLDPHPIRPAPLIVTMSATTTGAGSTHNTTPADEQHPVSAARLHAPKRLHPIEVRTSRTAAAALVPDALSRLALAMTKDGRLVGVVVNTVARARAVFDRVRTQCEAVLLTGRSRPTDRDYLLAAYYERLRAGRARNATPLVLVATQTIEVGANIDLDVLVTESAPLDALIQRLGRLNRLGEITTQPAPALVVHDGSVTDDDPVYGPARLATWQWLCTLADPSRYSTGFDPEGLMGGRNASPLALRDMASGAPANLLTQPDYVPVLTESTLDAWARTSPAPHPDPPIAHYLHGLAETRPGVRIVWRTGLFDLPPGQWREQVEQLPPDSDEEVEVPIAATRRWLETGASDATVADLDSQSDTPIDPTTLGRPPKRVRDSEDRPLVLRVRGRDDAQLIPSNRLAPGDLIVVPAEYGGCDRYGWAPTSATPATDVADLARRHGRPVLRIGPYLRTIIAEYHDEFATPALDNLLSQALVDAESKDVGAIGPYEDLLDQFLAHTQPDDQRPLITNLRSLRRRGTRLSLAGTGPWHVLLTRRGPAFADDRSPTGSSVTGRRITLAAHQAAVARRASEFARNLDLPDQLVAAVELAARLHDEGKRDPRFQAMLWGGDRRRAEVAANLLAKSGMDPTDRAAYWRAQRQSGYPRRLRHEALSARIAAVSIDTQSGVDPDLVVHLVAAHHGHGRPLLPAVSDPRPVRISVSGHVLSTEDTVDWEAPARFAHLNQRYGRWGLALLETVVRLADIWCSALDEELP